MIDYYKAHKVPNFGGKARKVNKQHTTKKKKTRKIIKTLLKPTKTKHRRKKSGSRR
jgi:hypothetical protein